MHNTDTHLDFDRDLAVTRSYDNPVYDYNMRTPPSAAFPRAEEQGIRVKPVEEVELSALDKEAGLT